MTERAPQRDVDGVVLLDKPVGMTSNRALQAVKRLFRARKAGHTGSLDPLASGLLPICLGQATKLSAYLLDADKHYRVTAQLGSRTDTGDADGIVIETAAAGSIDPDALERVLERFRGRIDQVPPMYSALKHQGRRLYSLARQGQVVERRPRQVEIHRLDLERYADGALDLDVECSKGTYIRSLVEDIAVAAGTLAHVTVLRRLGVGPYRFPEMVALEKLEAIGAAGEPALDELLLPADSALAKWPAVHIDIGLADRLMQGRAVAVGGEPAGLVRVYAGQHRFLGVGELKPDGWLAPRRLFVAGLDQSPIPARERGDDLGLFRGSPNG